MLDLTRIESGRLSVSIEAVEFVPLLEETLALVQGLAAERSIDIDAHLPTEPLVVQADRIRLKQILINLLSDRIKCNREGGRVSVALSKNGADRLEVPISDSGDGLAPEQMETVFEPYTRHSDDSVEGTGIGLSISRKLMEGDFGTESIPGEGSRFWFTLPMDDAQLLDIPYPIEDERPELIAIRSKNANILYVEDNPANLRLVERLIAQRRPEVSLISAPSAEIGLSLERV